MSLAAALLLCGAASLADAPQTHGQTAQAVATVEIVPAERISEPPSEGGITRQITTRPEGVIVEFS